MRKVWYCKINNTGFLVVYCLLQAWIGGYMVAVVWCGTGFNKCDTRNPHGGEGYVRHNIMRTVV